MNLATAAPIAVVASLAFSCGGPPPPPARPLPASTSTPIPSTTTTTTIPMPDRLNGHAGRWAGAGAAMLPARFVCVLRPDDRFDYRTEGVIAIDATKSEAGVITEESSLLELTLESAVRVDDSGEGSGLYTVSYTTSFDSIEGTVVDASNAPLAASDIPAVASSYMVRGDNTCIGEPNIVSQRTDDLSDVFRDLGIMFAAGQVSTPPPLRFAFSHRRSLDVGDEWAHNRRPSTPATGRWPSDLREPLLEMQYSLAEAGSVEGMPSITVDYMTVTGARLDADSLNQRRGEEALGSSGERIVKSLVSPEISGRAQFLLAPSRQDDDTWQVLPYRITERYTAMLVIDWETGSMRGMLADAPSVDYEETIRWTVETDTLLTGMDTAD